MPDISTMKTRADQRDVQIFLERSLGYAVESLQPITGGEVALAFDVTTSIGPLIFRLGPSERNFIKDKVAFENFCSNTVPIPAIRQIGRFNDNLFFAVSEKAPGIRLDLLDAESEKLLRPALMQTLSTIHLFPAPPDAAFGRWGVEPRSSAESWPEHARASAEKGFPAGRSVDEAFQFQEWHERLIELSRHLPNLRQLVHGDPGYNNAFAHDDKISSVIDWAESFYGDPLYDVAWLCVWSQDDSYLADYLATPAGKMFGQDSVAERIEFYKLRIGIGGLAHFERSNQWGAYETVFHRLERGTTKFQ